MALTNLAKNNDANQTIIRQEGGIPVIIQTPQDIGADRLLGNLKADVPKAPEAADAQKDFVKGIVSTTIANTNTTKETKCDGSLKFVTAVTHISQWSPPKVGGTALVCIGVLEYSKPTHFDQNDLYLMKRYPTIAPMDLDGTKITDAKQKDEFMVSFVDANLQKEDIDLALGKMQVEGNERVVKHVGTVEACMNGDVTRNFRMKNGFCGDADGLYKIVPGQSFDKLEYVFDEKGLTIKKLFETMRENECDYLVVIGKESTETFTVQEGGVLRERVEPLAEEMMALMKQAKETPDGEEKEKLMDKLKASLKPLQESQKQIEQEEETLTSQASAPVRGDKPILKSIKTEGETKELDSVSQWKPPVMNGRALIAFGHSLLGGDEAAIDGYSMKKDEFMVSYTDPLCAQSKQIMLLLLLIQ